MLVLCVILFAICVFLYTPPDIVKQNILTKETCEAIIQLAKGYQFSEAPDTVDNEAEYQINIIDGDVKHIPLWNVCKNVLPKNGTVEPTFVFLRRYMVGERTWTPPHYDTSCLSQTVLLSDPSDFKGGKLYIFDRKTSNKIEDTIVDDLNPHKLIQFIQTHDRLPFIDYKQGDMISYDGSKHLHGIIPVTQGERYVLAFFFSSCT
jgi:hypothetical protein